jgi:hypothetical protein
VHPAAQGSEARFWGELQVKNPPDAVTLRAVDALACPEVVEALSLIAAISLEPELAPSPSQPGFPPRAAPDPGPSAPTFTAIAPPPLELGALAVGVAHGAAAPKTALGMGFALAAEWPGVGHFRPSLQMGVYQVQSGDSDFVEGAVRAHFQLRAAYALFCPVRFPRNGRWALRPCVDLDLGALSGTGNGAGLIRGSEKVGLWASGGLGLQGQAVIWGPLRLSLLFSGVAPFGRHEFFFGPDTLAFRVPAVGWRAAACLGLMF